MPRDRPDRAAAAISASGGARPVSCLNFMSRRGPRLQKPHEHGNFFPRRRPPVDPHQLPHRAIFPRAT